MPQVWSWIKIANNQKRTTISGKTDRTVTQEVRERYGDEASAGATSISQNIDEFTEAAAKY